LAGNPNPPNIQDRLREGIEAARRGDRVNARRLLQQVLIIERDNEVALMWMASVVDSLSERRAFLERALRLNPSNTRAREALQKMGAPIPADIGSGTGAARTTASSRPAAPRPAATSTRSGGVNPYLLAAGIVAALTIIIVIAALLSDQTQTPALDSVNATFAAANSGINAAQQPTVQPTIDTRPPTDTPFFGVIVTLDPNRNVLPPTFTPTFTPLPTDTPTPTATPFPPELYTVLFTAYDESVEQASLFTSSGTGENLALLGTGSSGYSDIAFDSIGQRFVFVRYVEGTPANTDPDSPTPPDISGIPQLFITTPNAAENVVQITGLTGSRLSSPRWSPNNEQIVFSSNEDGDDEIWIVNIDGNNLRQLTANSGVDLMPDFSPDGTKIVFASDQESPGLLEIYELDLQTNAIRRLTDEAGSNYYPRYSPDGTRIAFLSDQGGDADIYIMDADGQRKFLLTIDDNGAEDRAITWSPEGEYIAFASTRESENFQWYLLRLRDNAIFPLVEIENEAQSISFIPPQR